jgi:hypothetical protein
VVEVIVEVARSWLRLLKTWRVNDLASTKHTR